MISSHRKDFRRKVSCKEITDKENQLQKELDYWNTQTDENLQKIENIRDGETEIKTFVSPCYGDPCNRDVMSGGYIQKENFLKPGSVVTNDEGEKYLIAGPRYHVALDSADVKVCIVTCGGLCPGLNVVIRELVMSLKFNYGVHEIYGIKWGYQGFYDDECWVKLDSDTVKEIHTEGGTILGSCRGGFDGPKISKAMLDRGINMGFFIGGDGTHRGVKALTKIFREKKEKIVLVGIPKTIDNDIPIIDRSFGLDTAVAESVHVIRAANVEANCSMNGIGLVKLFGRNSGYVAMFATLAARDVNICLMPEVPFNLYGENGLLDYIVRRLEVKHHCVIVVGEGAGFAVKDYNIQVSGGTDKSGNLILPDIGKILKDEIKKYANDNGMEINLKYIDPTYIVRAGAANSFDCNLCAKLAQNAVHCAFAGYTNFSIGIINNRPAMIPIDKISQDGVIRKIRVTDDDYLMMLASTGQPSFFPNVCLSNEQRKKETKEMNRRKSSLGLPVEGFKDIIDNQKEEEKNLEEEEKSIENEKNENSA